MSLKSTFSLLSIILLSLFATAAAVSRQPPGDPSLSGMVEGVTSDFVGALVPNAILLFERGEFSREVKSDEAGRFEVELPAGVYRVTVKKFGIFDPFQRKAVRVRAGKTKKFNVVLKYDLKKHPPVT